MQVDIMKGGGITLHSEWKDFKKPADFRTWLDLAKADGQGMDEWWGDLDGCNDCKYIDCANVWCTLCDAPATRNPVLNDLGKACCGFGHERHPEQLSLWLQCRAPSVQPTHLR